MHVHKYHTQTISQRISVRGWAGLQNEFQDSQSSREKPCLEKAKKEKTRKSRTSGERQTLAGDSASPGASELLFVITVIIMTIIVMSHPGLYCSLRAPEPLPSEPALEFRTLHFLLVNSFVAWQ